MRRSSFIYVVFISLVFLCCRSFAAEPAAHSGNSAGLNKILQRVESGMAGMHTLRTDFVQEKKLAMFDQTLHLNGTICLEKPDRFAWHVTSPVRYSMVMEGTHIRQWDEDTRQVQTVSISGNPAFQAAMTQMQEWFSGTYSALLDEYRVSVINRTPVILEFVPREGVAAAGMIRSVTVTFREDERYIHRIEIREVSGDSTCLTFSNTALNVPLGPDAWKVGPRAN